MPRRRKGSTTAVREVPATSAPSAVPAPPAVPTAPQPQPKESKKMAQKVLDFAEIARLRAAQKTKGEYDAEIAEFLSSGHPGVEVSLEEGRFAGKKGENVKTGLDNARKRTNEAGTLVHSGGNYVSVMLIGSSKPNEDGSTDEQHVYLFNTALSAESDDETPEDEA